MITATSPASTVGGSSTLTVADFSHLAAFSCNVLVNKLLSIDSSSALLTVSANAFDSAKSSAVSAQDD